MASSAIALRSDKPLTAAMTAVVWELAGALDRIRQPVNAAAGLWLEVEAVKLRGDGSRSDNVWLRECLRRLTGIEIGGEAGGVPWGAVLVAEWEITEGGSLVRVLLPPSAVAVLKAPETFARIEARAAHGLSGHAQRLYALLADRKRQGRPEWRYELGDLRAALGVAGRKSYDRWDNLRARVLVPAVREINDFGTVRVEMIPQRVGRSIRAVTFRWRWLDPREAADTDAQNERHSEARRKVQGEADAPPLVADDGGAGSASADPARSPGVLRWWRGLDPAAREAAADRFGRTFEAGGLTVPRREADLAALAYEAHEQSEGAAQ